MQTAFVRELTRECRERGIHTAIETSLFADKEGIKRALEFIDLVFVDVKHIDPEIHAQFTGVRNERILGKSRNDRWHGKGIHHPDPIYSRIQR